MDETPILVFTCMDDDFAVESSDENELIQVVKMHARDKHGMEVTDEEIKAQLAQE